MCGLFGFHCYGSKRPNGIKDLLQVLAVNSMERGMDATGIAFINKGKMEIVKANVPASKLKYSLPKGCKSVMGHTRRTTQGHAKDNYNNHPFSGSAKGKEFAFAHNGVLDNEFEVKDTYKLPFTKILTDSYVACQLTEALGDLSLKGLKKVGETVEGMFAFTYLDVDGNLSIVKNDSPFVIAHFSKLKMYVYASTREILIDSLMSYVKTFPVLVDKLMESGDDVEFIEPNAGTIMQINKSGQISSTTFKPIERMYWNPKYDIAGYGRQSKSSYDKMSYDAYDKYDYHHEAYIDEEEKQYMESLRREALFYITDDDFSLFLKNGYDAYLIEDMLFNGELEMEVSLLKKYESYEKENAK